MVAKSSMNIIFFVRCLHPHHPLWNVAKKLDTDGESGDGRQIFDEYLNLKVNMSQHIYRSEKEVVDVRLDEFEEERPEYKSRTHLVCSLAYLKKKPYDLRRMKFANSETGEVEARGG